MINALLICLLAIFVVIAPHASAQTDPQTDFSVDLANWALELDRLEQRLDVDQLGDAAAKAISVRLNWVAKEAEAARERAAANLEGRREQLDALGPPPEDRTEPAEIARTRARLNDTVALDESNMALAELMITRAHSLQDTLAERRRTRLLETILATGPLPYTIDTVSKAVPGFFTLLAAVAAVPVEWWASLSPENQKIQVFFAFGLMVTIAILVAWVLRRLVLNRMGPYPTEETPAYSRRLLAAFAEGLAKGIVPAGILIIIVARTRMEGAVVYGPFGDLIGLTAAYAVLFLLVTALPHAVLLPEHPAWRLTRLPAAQAWEIMRHIYVIAILFCAGEFLFDLARSVPSVGAAMTEPLRSMLTFGLNIAQGIAVFSLLRARHWIFDPPDASVEAAADPDDANEPKETVAEDEESEENGNVGRSGGYRAFWMTLRTLLALLALAGMIAPALGFVNFGNYLMTNMMGTACVVGILYILRGLFREVIGLATSSNALRDRLGMPHVARRRIKLLLRFGVDLSMMAIGVVIVAPRWGVPAEELSGAIGVALGTFTIGSFQFSILEIAVAILCFLIVMGLTGASKRILDERILPETQIDPGLRHSITAGVGYVGFILAVLVAVIAAGFDLTNLALIAGALSVGIGFGLQGIVNNFVSGVILLIERPIKVGDWVVVGQHEGFVKHINMRATEIETWQRASVIVPNADLLSSALTNWTHKDKIGRVDVAIEVARDSDPDKVEALLYEIGSANPRARRHPAPIVHLRAIEGDRMRFELRIFTSDILWVFVIETEIRKAILRRFAEEGITIPLRRQIVHWVEGVDGEPAPAGPPPEMLTGQKEG